MCRLVARLLVGGAVAWAWGLPVVGVGRLSLEYVWWVIGSVLWVAWVGGLRGDVGWGLVD